jgi:hypothetical protein
MNNGFAVRLTPQLTESTMMKTPEDQLENKTCSVGPFYEVLTAEELASRWRVPVTWVREQTRSRCQDPIPHIRLGRYVRFSWNSPELAAWWKRRQSSNRHAA